MSEVDSRPQQNGTNNVEASPRRCGPRPNTADRLFGGPTPVKSSIKVNNTFRSSIFEAGNPTPPTTPKKKAVPILERNPVTGEVKGVPAKVQV
ncbi:hypothetical protein M3Y97_00868600 [Aphelenchoides bicaudatus]|nr:hypothetical protein M3Y97_00868600 [Aphelenchoides bicaudatus]